MKLSEFLYVANWKMQLSFKESISFCWNHKDDLEVLSAKENVHIVLCPSFDALHLISQVFVNSELSVGAQSCSAHEFGPYTGEVSARSISQIGCEFCIIGHSERRKLFGQTDEIVAQKVQQAIKNNLYPIICVGETKQQHDEGQAKEIIKKQISFVCEAIKKTSHKATVCFAYEPVWAIGSGIVPENNQIEEVLGQIQAVSEQIVPDASVAFLYGGSVNGQNAQKLREISGLGGFLIGGASLDFQKFEKIVT